jgi:hypothetical protein
MLWGALLKNKIGKWLIGTVGAVYILYVIVAIVRIAMRTGIYGVPLVGHIILVNQNGESVYSSLHIGYYLACVSGLACLSLALLRDRITGQPKIKT